ncbi:hypothetical protein GEV43_09565 [Actinomadura sp. J1-007]|nr:hypothetical protein [Actinomadura sp. J1-007]
MRPGGRQPPARAPGVRGPRPFSGRFEHEPDGRACTLIYSPVVAQAAGSWHGRPAKFRREFPNDCVMRAHTDSLFTF